MDGIADGMATLVASQIAYTVMAQRVCDGIFSDIIPLRIKRNFSFGEGDPGLTVCLAALVFFERIRRVKMPTDTGIKALKPKGKL